MAGRIVRYADDPLIMARYQGARIDEWKTQRLVQWLGLSINREKTSVVRLKRGEILDFIGFTFWYDHDLHGHEKDYPNIGPSKTRGSMEASNRF